MEENKPSSDEEWVARMQALAEAGAAKHKLAIARLGDSAVQTTALVHGSLWVSRSSGRRCTLIHDYGHRVRIGFGGSGYHEQPKAQFLKNYQQV